MQAYQSSARTELCALVQGDNTGVDGHIVDEVCGTVRELEEGRVLEILDFLKEHGELISAEAVLRLITE